MTLLPALASPVGFVVEADKNTSNNNNLAQVNILSKKGNKHNSYQ